MGCVVMAVFFQAENGIRDGRVTGVQTCALPISMDSVLAGRSGLMAALVNGCYAMVPIPDPKLGPRRVDIATMYNVERSEERRVGKECRARGWARHKKKKADSLRVR